MNRGRFTSFLFFLGLMHLSQVFAPCISANELTFYYDPETGNVSLDTSNTRSGEILIYYLNFYSSGTEFRFRPENHILLTSSPLGYATPFTVQEVSYSPIKGYYTIGDVLPSGLQEDSWNSLFTIPNGYAGYSPGLGLPENDPIRFVYGQPNRNYDNRWDLVDPDEIKWATDASLIYREAAGEVLLDTRGNNGGHISGFYLRLDGHFLYDSFTPPWESLAQFNNADQVDFLGNALEPGLHSLGPILETGLSKNQFESLFTLAGFLGNSGFTGDLELETESQAFALVFEAVPEPCTAAQFFSAALIFGARRRLRASRAIARR